MYCEKCGSDIPEVEICPKCGCLSGYRIPKSVKAKKSETQKLIFKIISIVAIVLAVLDLLYNIRYLVGVKSIGNLIVILSYVLLIVAPISLLLNKRNIFIISLSAYGIYWASCTIISLVRYPEYFDAFHLFRYYLLPILICAVLIFTSVKKSKATGIVAIVLSVVYLLAFIGYYLLSIIGSIVFVALSTALLFKILSEEKSEKTETVN